MSSLANLTRATARLAAHDVLRNAARVLTQAGHVDAALLITQPEHWHEFIRSATEQVVDALPKEEPPTTLPKSWPFPSNAPEALI